eukprot:4295752-Pleurochrysis_carterae.AAC.2
MYTPARVRAESARGARATCARAARARAHSAQRDPARHGTACRARPRGHRTQSTWPVIAVHPDPVYGDTVTLVGRTR